MAALLIGYARCSTDQQDLTAQHDGLTALGVSPARIYVDHGLTGTTRDRPGLREAIWKVQNPPSVGVLRRDRSIASAWACPRVIGPAPPCRSSPGLAAPGPATQTCCSTSSRSEFDRCNGTVRYQNCWNTSLVQWVGG